MAIPLLHVFQDPGGPIELFAPDKPPGWVSPLNADAGHSDEAAGDFYTSHAFNFLETDTAKQLAFLRQFLTQIGPRHAEKLGHVCINFPLLEEGGSRHESLEEVDILVSNSPNIRVLELYVNAKEYDVLAQRLRDASKQTEQEIADFNDRVRKLVQLERVIVRFYTGTADANIEQAFAKVKWEILPKYAAP